MLKVPAAQVQLVTFPYSMIMKKIFSIKSQELYNIM